ncbi:MAG: hypothetical protein M3N82_06775 [Pseudomonadota bacterium]|nr:hypothetical protein [Pseudomonadota bacterium]
MQLATATTLMHVHLAAGAALTLAVDATRELGLYVLDGALAGDDGAVSGAGALVVLTAGDSVRIAATAGSSLDVALLGGAPVQGPVLFSGPFVMDTQERLAQARRDFASGRMGTLDGVPFAKNP